MNFNFKNKNVFISGATHGIGLACILSFAKLGANVITFSRDKTKISLLKKKLNSLKATYFIEEGDVLDEKFIHSFSQTVLKKYKKIEILIHNVGGGGRWGKENFLNTNLSVWDEVYKKNNNGTVIFSKYFLPSMIKNNWGRVIAIGSVSGIETQSQHRPWFVAAKAAQHAIIKSFSKKNNFTKRNITFNTVSPGPIFIRNTGWDVEKKQNLKNFNNYVKNFIPTKNMGEPKDISNMCIYLCSDYAKYINGSNIVIDGGLLNSI